MVEILDKTKSSPKWVSPGPVPIFKTTLEADRYWAEEKRRWREGYGDGYAHICGMHYFYLTQGKLKDGSDGDIITPKYRDGDEWIITELHNAFWDLKNHVGMVKRREIGATSIGAGLLPAYTFKMFPSSTFGMTSCDKDRIYKAYKDKSDVMFKRLHKDIAPVLDKTIGWKENSTKQQVSAILPWYVKNKETGEMEYQFSDYFAKETSDTDDSATGFSGSRLRSAYLDEFPLHKRKQKLLGSAMSTVMKQANQSGLLFWAGTVEDTITAEQIGQLKTLVADSKELNFKVVFAPAWWCLFMDENGISDEKKGVEWVMKERERLDKLEDKTFLKAFTKNYPLTLDEIFELGGAGRYDEETIDRINAQNKYLSQNKPPVVPHKIEVKRTPDGNLTTVDAEIDPNYDAKKGGLLILEHPKPNVKYIVGYDGILTSQLSSSDSANSKMAAVVMKGVDPQSEIEFAPVAVWSKRPRSIDAGNVEVVDIVQYYNKYGGVKFIGELNAGGENAIVMAQKRGLGKTIMNKRDLSKKGYVDTKKLWFYRTDDVLDWQNEAANVYYKKYAHKVMFKSLIADALKNDDDNYDEEDAFKACLYGFGSGDILDVPVKKKKKKTIQLLKYVDGRPVWYEVVLSNGDDESD